MALKLNTSYLSSFLNEDELKGIAVQAEAAAKVLHEKTGLGNDFLGWLTLPTDYDKEEFARIPAMLQTAVWLYYKPDSSKKVKPGAATQDKPGTVRELARMSDQFSMTYDIVDAKDAGKLWKLLPSQFNKFKGDAQH